LHVEWTKSAIRGGVRVRDIPLHDLLSAQGWARTVGKGMLVWELPLSQARGCWAVQVTYSNPEISIKEQKAAAAVGGTTRELQDQTATMPSYVSLASQRGLDKLTVETVRFVVEGCGEAVEGQPASGCEWRVLQEEEACPVQDSSELILAEGQAEEQLQKLGEKMGSAPDKTGHPASWLFFGQLAFVFGVILYIFYVISGKRKRTHEGNSRDPKVVGQRPQPVPTMASGKHRRRMGGGHY
jgi:hypothetical protein